MQSIFNKATGVIPNNAIESVAPKLNEATQYLNNYVLSPIQKLGIAGFLFDKIATSNVRTETQYTNNYVERGAFLTDHSITKPKKITITGYVGEKVYSTEGEKNLLTKIAEKMPVILSAIPKLTTGMQQLKDKLDKQKKKDEDNAINAGVDFWNVLKSIIPPKTKSGKAFAYLEALRLSNAILSLTEPDGTYHSNMVIISLDKATREDTLDIVDFVVELQEWRTADTLYAKFDASQYAGNVADAKSETVNLGNTQANSTQETIDKDKGLYEHMTGRSVKPKNK